MGALGKVQWQDVAEAIAEALARFPPSAWEKILERQPEYCEMRDLARRFQAAGMEGAFLTVEVMAALNDYAERSERYWQDLAEWLSQALPRTLQELKEQLKPFYEKRRYRSNKLDRMNRFLESEAARALWAATPREVASEFRAWHDRIAQAMGQRKTDKTIITAVKALAAGLLLLGERGVDFSGIPVAVDERVQSLTPFLKSKSEIQRFWDDGLDQVRRKGLPLTALELDSLLWQIAKHDEEGQRAYLEGLGIDPDTARAFLRGLQQARSLGQASHSGF